MGHPPLTTLGIPKEKAGRRAVDLLLHLLADPSGTATFERELPTELLVRQSTAPARP